jgi:hypothetical protein
VRYNVIGGAETKSDYAHSFSGNCILSFVVSISEGRKRMSAQSKTMMNLLKELALLKELDGKSETESDAAAGEQEARKIRRREITDQIKALGEAAG